MSNILTSNDIYEILSKQTYNKIPFEYIKTVVLIFDDGEYLVFDKIKISYLIDSLDIDIDMENIDINMLFPQFNYSEIKLMLDYSNLAFDVNEKINEWFETTKQRI